MMKRSKRRLYSMAAVLLLLVSGFYLFARKAPVSGADFSVYQEILPNLIQKANYYSLRPNGEVTGGVVIFPDSKEDPASYAPLAKKLAEQGLEIRVVKYPLGFMELSRAERTILDDGSQLPWISLGIGSGVEKACILADKSNKVAGLILTSICSSQVNLNDNDVQVIVYQPADQPLAAGKTADIRKRMPADAKFVTVGSRADIMAEISGNQPEIQEMKQSVGLVSEIKRLIANKGVNQRNK